MFLNAKRQRKTNYSNMEPEMVTMEKRELATKDATTTDLADMHDIPAVSISGMDNSDLRLSTCVLFFFKTSAPSRTRTARTRKAAY